MSLKNPFVKSSTFLNIGFREILKERPNEIIISDNAIVI